MRGKIDTNAELNVTPQQCAVPMVGFGFMDNIIMIQVGDLIDSTLGVTFGLATITALVYFRTTTQRPLISQPI